MNFVMDMVHYNPGEKPFDTEFTQPEKLIKYGYNTQVYRYIATAVSFEKMGGTFFDKDGQEWLEQMQCKADKEINAAHNAGLMTMTHMDLFVLPKLLVEKYKDEICNEEGKIDVYREKTKEIHRVMFDEMFERYPLDGLIIRVGETYLHDTPYHVGNGAIKYGDIEQEKKTFVELIKFLREEICVRHGKYLVFRTWDIFPDHFHANSEYYLDVTNQIEPHENLIFSIKHTKLDFWRRVKFNPCLGIGNHGQVIEVQCAREYEGKGAYPMYVMDGVINAFSELQEPKGIKDMVENPLYRGIFAWSRGGGWGGPYIQNEFWCDLNAYVIGMYGKDTSRTEEEIFLEYACKEMGMDMENARKFHTLCSKKVPEAVLHGRGIEAYDLSLNEEFMPCGLWVRDDRIGGLRQLNKVFRYLEEQDAVGEALKEKEYAVQLWKEIKEDFSKIEMDNVELRFFIQNSIEYAIRFYTILNISMQIFAKCRKKEGVKELLKQYDAAWKRYKELEARPQFSSSYKEEYIFSENNYGLNETIAYCRENLNY